MGRSIHSKPAVSAWLIRERKRMGWKPRDVAEALTMRGLPVMEGTVRTWEAGRNPSPENVEGLEAVFDSRAPESPGGGDTLAPGLSELVAAMKAQTEAISGLVNLLTPLVGELDVLQEQLADARAGRELLTARVDAIEADRAARPAKVG